MSDAYSGPDTYRNEGLPPIPEVPSEPIEILMNGEAPEPKLKNGVLEIELPDGSLILDFTGGKALQEQKDKKGAQAHDANLAEYIDDLELGRISSDLLDGINNDLESRKEWLERRASGLKHLALKVENPRSPSADADTAVEGQSTVRWPGLLDAVLRFAATARGELLPSSGPVKIRNDTRLTISEKEAAAAVGLPPDHSDDLADALEADFNHYLTVVDKPYYADTNRMFVMQGFGGSGFKKVYFDPMVGRPISRSVDAEDVIVGDSEISLWDCGRVTHRIMMRQSTFKRMLLSSHYRDWDTDMRPQSPEPDPVELAKDEIGGFSSKYTQRPADYKHTLYECYTELNIEGFEHKQDGEITGLPIPYRVTIDKDSQKVLEVRRNWREGDQLYVARMPLVKFPFVDGLSFYGIGLLDIMGNATAAISSAWRLALDSAGFASWPGFLYSDLVGRQDTMNFRVGLGAGVRVNTGGQDIRNSVMPLPYKDVTAGLVQVMQMLMEEARRVGGTPELMVGEGRADVPVGTTLAMIDQAQKVLDAVHKGMHMAQAEEFSLLRDLFIEYPEALLCNPHAKQWERDDLVRSLQNCYLTPQADPNTPSHTMRVMKAVALTQLVQLDPTRWDLAKVFIRVAHMVGLGSVEDMILPPQQGGPQVDMAKMADVQAKFAKLAADERESARKLQLQSMDTQLRLLMKQMDQRNSASERMSREKVESMRQQTQAANLAGQQALQNQKMQHDRQMDLVQMAHDRQDMVHDRQLQAEDRQMERERFAHEQQQSAADRQMERFKFGRDVMNADRTHELGLEKLQQAKKRVI